MDIIQSNKGGSKLCFEGYIYTKHALRKTKQWWKCTLKSSTGCRGSLHTDLQHENETPGQPHNHPPDDTSIRLAKARQEMKTKATTTHDRPSQIFAETVSNCSNAVKARLPTEHNVKRSIRRYRPQEPVPETLAELRLPDRLTQTLGDEPEQFLIHDNGADSQSRVLVFATRDNLELLAAADTLFMDGTFDTAPPLFKQIYNIRIPFSSTYITLAYGLLQHKRRHTYEEFLQAIKDNCTNLGLQMNVETIVTDFEDSVLRAEISVFGRQLQQRGCFYHLT